MPQTEPIPPGDGGFLRGQYRGPPGADPIQVQYFVYADATAVSVEVSAEVEELRCQPVYGKTWIGNLSRNVKGL